jgi:hypothetical protein
MANRRVGLYKYLKVDGKWKYCKAVFHANNHIKPHTVMTSSGKQTIKDGYYCLSFGGGWENVGDDPTEAVKALLRKRGELQTTANGGTVVQQTTSKVPEGNLRGTVKAAFEAWVQEEQDKGPHSETVRAKRMVGREFCQSCKVKMLSALTRADCLGISRRIDYGRV